MFVRVNTVTGAKDIDGGIAYLRDEVLPELRGQNGFRGLTASANRETGEVGILGLWDTLDDLEASNSTIVKVRDATMKVLGGEISVVIMEQVVAEVAAPRDFVGCSLRLVRIEMSPAIVNEQVKFFESMVVPELKSTPGFVAVRTMVDRGTGAGMVGTVWADEEAMRAAEGAADERRRQAAGRGVTVSDPTYRTILLTQLV